MFKTIFYFHVKDITKDITKDNGNLPPSTNGNLKVSADDSANDAKEDEEIIRKLNEKIKILENGSTKSNDLKTKDIHNDKSVKVSDDYWVVILMVSLRIDLIKFKWNTDERKIVISGSDFTERLVSACGHRVLWSKFECDQLSSNLVATIMSRATNI